MWSTHNLVYWISCVFRNITTSGSLLFSFFTMVLSELQFKVHDPVDTHTHTVIGWYLRICLYLKVTVTEMTLHSELEDGCGVVLPHLCFLSVVSHSHTQVLSTSPTPHVERELKPKQWVSTQSVFLHFLAIGSCQEPCLHQAFNLK